MKSLFEKNIEQRLYEAAQAHLNHLLREDVDIGDTISTEMMENARKEAALSGEELLARYRKRSEKILNHKDKVNKLLDFIHSNHISAKDKKIFDKILGDHKILSKLVFVTDGSYRSNRIFYKNFNFDDYEGTSFGISDIYFPYKKDKWGESACSIDAITLLNHMKNNYKSIFIELVSDTVSKTGKYIFLCDDGMGAYYDNCMQREWI